MPRRPQNSSLSAINPRPDAARPLSGTAPEPVGVGPVSEATALRAADTMFALSTPSRLQIVLSLRSGPQTVSEIVAAVGLEQSAVSHQLRVLRSNSLVSMRRVGRSRVYELRNAYTAALIEAALAHVRELEQPHSGSGS